MVNVKIRIVAPCRPLTVEDLRQMAPRIGSFFVRHLISEGVLPVPEGMNEWQAGCAATDVIPDGDFGPWCVFWWEPGDAPSRLCIQHEDDHPEDGFPPPAK